MSDRWMEDPQGREDVEKVSRFLKLPVWKASALGDFRRFWNELWVKIDAFAENVSNNKLDKGGYNGTAQELFNLIKNYCPYQIGDIYQTTNKVNPSEIWQGTEWQRIEGRVLKGTSGERNSKEIGGSNTVKLSVDNIPSHNHSATNSAHTHSSGNHNHYIFSSGTGGSHITDSSRKEHAPNYRAVLRNTTDRDDYVIAGSGGTANAGRTSSSSITIGSATPTTTIGSTGKGTEFSVENEYYTVHMWLRTK